MNKKELIDIFDNCRKQFCEKLSEIIRRDGTIIIDEDKLIEEKNNLSSLPLIPASIYEADGNLMIEYRESQEVDAFGLLNAEIFDSYLEDFSLDEIYFIANCIKDYQKED